MIVKYLADGRVEEVNDFYGARLYEQGAVIAAEPPKPSEAAEPAAEAAEEKPAKKTNRPKKEA